MGSKRLPGKMTEMLGKDKIIEWVIKRMKLLTEVEEIILATSENEKDKCLVDIAKCLSIKTFTGSEENVLNRFLKVSEIYNAKHIVRICADNPFVSHLEVEDLIKHYLDNSCDYSCNHQDRNGSKFPDGFGAEIFSKNVISYIEKQTKDKKHLEHVTSYIWDNTAKFKLNIPLARKEIQHPNLKFDVDTKDDLDFLKKLISKGVKLTSTPEQIISITRNLNKI